MRLPGTPYDLQRPLGEGGIGEVYSALHVELGVQRAVKLLKRELSGQKEVLTRFTREARILAQLRHPNLVEVVDLGVSADGRPFFAMELLRGRTLRDVLLDRGALRADQAVTIAVAVLDALEPLHHEGFVHRDVKPENVFLVSGGGVKLLDLGIARVEPDAVRDELTAEGASLGTPRYMAPEQARGERVDARADVWAVGALVWEMASGEPPHADLDGELAAVRASLEGLPRGVFAPPQLVDVVFRATRPDPALRPPSAASMRAELLGAVGGVVDDATTLSFSLQSTALVAPAPRISVRVDGPRPSVAPTPDAPRPAIRRRRGWPLTAAAASIAFAAVLALAALALGPPSARRPAGGRASAPETSAPAATTVHRPPEPSASPDVSTGAPSAPRAVVSRPPRAARSPAPPDDLPPSGL